jgi:hypothetical protein
VIREYGNQENEKLSIIDPKKKMSGERTCKKERLPSSAYCMKNKTIKGVSTDTYKLSWDQTKSKLLLKFQHRHRASYLSHSPNLARHKVNQKLKNLL